MQLPLQLVFMVLMWLNFCEMRKHYRHRPRTKLITPEWQGYKGQIKWLIKNYPKLAAFCYNNLTLKLETQEYNENDDVRTEDAEWEEVKDRGYSVLSTWLRTYHPDIYLICSYKVFQENQDFILANFKKYYKNTYGPKEDEPKEDGSKEDGFMEGGFTEDGTGEGGMDVDEGSVQDGSVAEEDNS